MSDTVQIALIVALPPTVAAVGAIIIGILADRRACKKLDHITILTNSTLAEAKARITVLEATIAQLIRERDA